MEHILPENVAQIEVYENTLQIEKGGEMNAGAPEKFSALQTPGAVTRRKSQATAETMKKITAKSKRFASGTVRGVKRRYCRSGRLAIRLKYPYFPTGFRKAGSDILQPKRVLTMTIEKEKISQSRSPET